MKGYCKKSVGFSLPELIVVMSIMATLIGLITINLTNAQQKASLNTVVQSLVSDIRQQQLKAMVGDTEGGGTYDSYGIHTDSNKYVLFKGTSYDPVASSNFKVDLPTNMQFLFPGLDAVFDRVSGDARFITLTNGLVGYWRFNEGTGQVVNNSSGSGNNGTLGTSTSSGPDDPTWATGKIGKALEFDGINDLVTYGIPSAALNNLSAFTYAAWVQLSNSTFSTNAGVVVRANDVIGMKLLLLDTSEKVFAVVDYSGDDAVSISSFSLSVGPWYHIAYTFDAAVDTKTRIYIDGQEAAYSTQIPGTGSISSDDTFNLTIGNTDTGVRPLPGKIDDVRIYNRALSALEIRYLYTGIQFELQDTTNDNIKTVQMNKYGVVTSMN